MRETTLIRILNKFCERHWLMVMSNGRFGIDVEPSGSATTELVIWILGKYAVRIRGWNWLRIVYNGGAAVRAFVMRMLVQP